jgi:YD repeat-containing protein
MDRRVSTLVPFKNTDSGTLYTYSSTSYDKTGKVINESTGKEPVLKDQYPFSFVSTDYEYYGNGNLKLVADSSGQKIYYEYDQDGNVELEEVYVDETNTIKTVYQNNHFGKPDVVTEYIRSGDIYGNTFEDEEEIELITTYTYDKNGNVESITTPDEVTRTFEYDNMDRRTKSIQPTIDIEGRTLYIENSTTYNWEGKPLTENDGNNNYTYYGYNKRGDLEIIKTPVTVDGETSNHYTAFKYDRAGRLVIEVSPKNYIEGIPLNSLNRTQYEYDGMDRLLQKSYVGKVTEYNASQNDFTTVERTVLISKNEYDEKGNLKRETDAIGYEEDYWTEYEYNLQGMNTSVLNPEAKDKGLSYNKKYVYDALGRIREEYTIKGGTQTQPSYETLTKYQYDDAGNILNIRVNKEGEPEKTIQVNTYDYLGNILTQKDGNNNITTYEYNGFNNLRKVIYLGDETIDSNIVTYQYDVMGNLRKSENSLGRIDLYTYNYQGQELTHTVQESDGSSAITTSAIYDRNGNLIYAIDARENTVMYQYDQLNRLVKERSTAGSVEHITEYIYDPNGNVEIERQKVKDGDSEAVREYTNVYDELNRLIQSSNPYNVIETLKYNDASLQTESYDAYNNVTIFEYDKNNRVIETKRESKTGEHIGTTTKTYDLSGNISSSTDEENNTTKYEYDEFDRLTKVINALNEETSYTYDLNGNMLTQTDGREHTTTYEYNVADLLIKRCDHGGRTGTEGNYTYMPEKTVFYEYHADGSLKEMLDRKGITSTYAYDVHGRLEEETAGNIEISYTYDENGNQLTITDDTGTTTRVYDELGRVISKTIQLNLLTI